MIESHRQTFYSVLGLTHDASIVEIERAVLLHRRVLQQHPLAERQREHLRLVEEARVVLLDPAKRAQYDRQLQHADRAGHHAGSRIATWFGWALLATFVIGLVWVTYQAQNASSASAAGAPPLDKKTGSGVRAIADGRSAVDQERTKDQ